MSKGGKVCIVGGGLAGLVSGKECLKAGLKPTIFDSAQALGGLWNPSLARCYRSLTTNLSRFTCSFSDFPWPAKASMFPTQADVGRYLDDYKEHFLAEAAFEMECRVTNINPKAGGTFEVSWKDKSDDTRTAEFDKVIIASGFYASKIEPSIEGLDSFTGDCIHSGDYRSPAPFSGKRVVVVGSSFSSAEIAAEIAPVASSVLNIMPKKSYILPRFLPLDPSSPSSAFLPLDLLLYRRRSAAETTQSPRDFNGARNAYLRSLFGSSGRDPLHAFRASGDGSYPPFVAVSDTYGNLCAAGKIEPVQGRLSKVDKASCQVSYTDPDQAAPQAGAAAALAIDNVDAIVLCTGYKPQLPFLSDELLQGADFQPDDAFLPLRLYRHVIHPTLHSLAFVGMYRGPYFGVTELQARLAAGVFSEQVRMPPQQAIDSDLQKTAEVRALDPRPQFPFPDYVGMMDSMATELGIVPPPELTQAGQSVVPSHYGDGDAATEASRQLESELEEMREGKLIAASIVRGLHGRWNFERQLISRLQGSPSGTVKGEIEFAGARGGVAGEEDLDYLEKGEFTTPFGSFGVSAQYLYCYNPEQDSLDVYFGPPDPRKERLFVRLRFRREEDGQGWLAVAEHRCGEDDYDAEYQFKFDGLNLSQVRIKFKVWGPTKDYSSHAVLTRA